MCGKLSVRNTNAPVARRSRLKVLEFSGVFQSDGYGSDNTHLNPMANVIHAGCNVHARRKFTECDGGPEVDHVLKEYSKLYKIESELEKANTRPDCLSEWLGPPTSSCSICY